jgi:hypothetical protein
VQDSWKIAVMIAAAFAGAGLGLRGSPAPRMPAAALLSVPRTASPPDARPAAQAGPSAPLEASTEAPTGPAASATDESTRPQSGAAPSTPNPAAQVTSVEPPRPSTAPRTARVPLPGNPPGPASPPPISPAPVTQVGPTRSWTVGPLLSDSEYAPHAYRIYPNPPSPQLERAVTGFRVTIRHASSTTIEVTMENLRSGATERATYESSYQLYFVEKDLDDDGVNGETNDADDFFILTDAAGHIIVP